MGGLIDLSKDQEEKLTSRHLGKCTLAQRIDSAKALWLRADLVCPQSGAESLKLFF